MPFKILRLLAVGALIQLFSVARGANDDRPNVVLILVDDLAWSDLHCYGNRIHDTPHLDRLANEGMRFTQAYAAAPICSASRAAIMTGKLPARLHFEFVTKDSAGQQELPVALQSPPFTLDLPLREQTLAELLTPAGYTAGFFGKWHLNRHHNGYLGWSPTHGPTRQGFAVGSQDFGAHPYSYRKDNSLRGRLVPSGKFPVDTLTENAASFVSRHQEERFFLFLSHYFVHDPVHSRCEWLIDEYRQRLPDGGPASRAAYGAMVETLDQLVGTLLQKLDDANLADQTMVVFMSDNGGHPNHTTNAPLRGSKWNLYEGGIRVPLIVRWPGHVPAASRCDEVVHGCDLLPTLCEAAKVAAPAESLDGVSIMPLLRDAESSLHRSQPVVWHFPYYHPEKKFAEAPQAIGVEDFATSQTRPHSALRQEKWKLLHFYEDDRVELYDLSNDLAEQHDLAAARPRLANELKAKLGETLAAVQARLPTAKSTNR